MRTVIIRAVKIHALFQLNLIKFSEVMNACESDAQFHSLQCATIKCVSSSIMTGHSELPTSHPPHRLQSCCCYRAKE